jgi:hypothetical protein
MTTTSYFNVQACQISIYYLYLIYDLINTVCNPRSRKMCQGSGNCLGYAAQDASGKLEPWRFDRREGKLGFNDVALYMNRGQILSEDRQLEGFIQVTSSKMELDCRELIGAVLELIVQKACFFSLK